MVISMTTTLVLIDGDIHDNYFGSNWWWYPYDILLKSGHSSYKATLFIAEGVVL
jgi:hypothetical protein